MTEQDKEEALRLTYEAVEAHYTEHREEWLKKVRHWYGNHYCEDIMQEGFYIALLNKYGFVCQPHLIGGFIYRCMVKAAGYFKNYSRGNDYEVFETALVSLPLEEEFEGVNTKEKLLEYIKYNVAPQVQESMILNYVYGMKDTDICRHCGITFHCLDKRKTRFRNKLIADWSN